MYRHHPFEERLHIVSRLKSGEPMESLVRETGLDKKWFVSGIFVMKSTEKMDFVEQGHIIIQP